MIGVAVSVFYEKGGGCNTGCDAPSTDVTFLTTCWCVGAFHYIAVACHGLPASVNCKISRCNEQHAKWR